MPHHIDPIHLCSWRKPKPTPPIIPKAGFVSKNAVFFEYRYLQPYSNVQPSTCQISNLDFIVLSHTDREKKVFFFLFRGVGSSQGFDP